MMELARSSLVKDAHKIDRLGWSLFGFRLLAVTLGGLHTWAAATSYSMNSDGISYLDIGEAYLRGDWQTAINAVWSPLYSWILGPVIYFLKPSIAWEFPVVQIVNFGIYLVALVCFEYFWRGLRSDHLIRVAGPPGDARLGLPAWLWLPVGYGLFIWSSLSLIELWAVTPDMVMAALVYLAAGLLVRIRAGSTGWPVFVALGLVLGLGYLAKAIMFPLAFVILGITFFSTPASLPTRGRLGRNLAALLVFLAVSLPFIALISAARGELTFSDASKVTYIRHVGGQTHPHWQGDRSAPDAPEHPSRKILDAPPVYEFGAPVGGTYPISYDPYYWYKGAAVDFSWEKQLSTLLASGLVYFDLFFRQQGVLVISVLVLYTLGFWRPASVTDLIRGYGLTILALVTFGLYSLVLVEGRYVGVFVVLFWADLLANIHIQDTPLTRRLNVGLGAAMVLFLLMSIAAFNLEGLITLSGQTETGGAAAQSAPPPDWPGAVAQELQRQGVQPGDRVGVIGYAFDSFWARLARVKIVAELVDVDADSFWVGDPALQTEVIRAFAGAGAKAIVAEHVPGYATLPGWHQVDSSNYYIYLVRE